MPDDKKIILFNGDRWYSKSLLEYLLLLEEEKVKFICKKGLYDEFRQFVRSSQKDPNTDIGKYLKQRRAEGNFDDCEYKIPWF
ncbi:hypothetical protein ACS2G7_27365 [Bacillus cereus group sp. BceL221]|uniref:hypothetical protein n=1 Tax=unclassified Bacillus cereus group TaxID=2750818 RepID=UPI0022E1AB32|nr:MULTISPECIES: hypothetical protein [unclassified Bacillus cereus group]MDA2196951.1 hypothetical protein [Bacillus cereus group sp. Bc238]MDA2202672.1 hypothetical protein [Bacillus cereus group sp. Bc237]